MHVNQRQNFASLICRVWQISFASDASDLLMSRPNLAEKASSPDQSEAASISALYDPHSNGSNVDQQYDSWLGKPK
jgi:hypothetical protein